MSVLFTICLLFLAFLGLIGLIIVLTEKEPFGFFIVVAFVGFSSLCLYAGIKEKERQAIVAGAAHYKTVIDKNGGVSNEFVWGPEKKK